VLVHEQTGRRKVVAWPSFTVHAIELSKPELLWLRFTAVNWLQRAAW